MRTCCKRQEKHRESVTRLQQQMSEARQVIEELETRSVLQIAEAKQQMHTTLEAKDGELQTLRASVTSLKQHNDELTEKVQILEKKCKCVLRVTKSQ